LLAVFETQAQARFFEGVGQSHALSAIAAPLCSGVITGASESDCLRLGKILPVLSLMKRSAAAAPLLQWILPTGLAPIGRPRSCDNARTFTK
jgi:hypothetical protein